MSSSAEAPGLDQTHFNQLSYIWLASFITSLQCSYLTSLFFISSFFSIVPHTISLLRFHFFYLIFQNLPTYLIHNIIITSHPPVFTSFLRVGEIISTCGVKTLHYHHFISYFSGWVGRGFLLQCTVTAFFFPSGSILSGGLSILLLSSFPLAWNCHSLSLAIGLCRSASLSLCSISFVIYAYRKAASIYKLFVFFWILWALFLGFFLVLGGWCCFVGAGRRSTYIHFAGLLVV